MTVETWVIINKETGEQWKARSGKSSWNKAAHAKNAWANTNKHWSSPSGYFDMQDKYILKGVSISALEQTIQKMEAMIKSEEWQQLKEFVCGNKEVPYN